MSRIPAILAMMFLFWGVTNAQAAKRIALVIGNSNYSLISPLKNPKNDADLMASSLKEVGFEVIKATDVDVRGMGSAVKRFGKALREAGKDAVGLFYYAGHGVQSRGENYLIPLGAEVVTEFDLDIEAMSASDILGQMESAGNALNVVVLDACRNNPFKTGFRSATRGFARVRAPSGALVAFSAAPGQVALDGTGDNSPYTAALAKTMKRPGLSLEQVFKRVRVSVEDNTSKAQTPWEESSLRGDFYFVPGAPAGSPRPSAGGNLSNEAIFWSSVKDSTTTAAIEEFLKQFPRGTFAGLANIKLEELKSMATVATIPKPEESPKKRLGDEQMVVCKFPEGWGIHAAVTKSACINRNGQVVKEIRKATLPESVNADDYVSCQLPGSKKPVNQKASICVKDGGRIIVQKISKLTLPEAVAADDYVSCRLPGSTKPVTQKAGICVKDGGRILR